MLVPAVIGDVLLITTAFLAPVAITFGAAAVLARGIDAFLELVL